MHACHVALAGRRTAHSKSARLNYFESWSGGASVNIYICSRRLIDLVLELAKRLRFFFKTEPEALKRITFGSLNVAMTAVVVQLFGVAFAQVSSITVELVDTLNPCTGLIHHAESDRRRVHFRLW